MAGINEREAGDLPPLKEEGNSKSLTEVYHGDSTIGVGELNFEEYTRGGLGRHLGVFSTICLM